MKSPRLLLPTLACLGAACLLNVVTPADALAYDVANGTTWTDTSGTDSANLLGSATLGADNSVINLSLSATANSSLSKGTGTFDTVTLSGTLTKSNNVTYSFNPHLVYTGTGPLLIAVNQSQLTFGNASSLTSSGGFTKSGSGTLVIASNNSSTLSGTVTLNTGTTSMLGGTGRLSSSTLLVMNNSAVLNLQDGNDTTVDTFTLNGGSVAVGGTNQANATLTANSFAFRKGSVAAHLVGASATLTKTTADTVTLTGTNTFGGATTISAGTLILSGAGSINSSSGASVATGATFTNNSSVAFNKSLTAAEGAVIDGSGVFTPTSTTLTANLSDGLTTLAFGTTAFTKAGTLELTLSGLTAGTYAVFSGSSISGSFTSTSISGTFLTDNGGGSFTGIIGDYSFSYSDTGNQLVVTAIPEPATFALIAGGLAALVVLRRRNKV